MLEYYTDKGTSEIQDAFQMTKKEHDALFKRVFMAMYSTENGKEYAQHGFMRRCTTLWRCINNIFKALPPNALQRPTEDQTKDATINLQCFYINTFGACDNLAWLLVFEKKIRRRNGTDLSPMNVGLRKGNTAIRANTSDDLKNLLDSFEEWFDHIDNFRHSLAHRIPLYVPPHVVRPEDAEKYRYLDKEAYKSLLEGNIERHEDLRAQQSDMEFFRPWYTHSFSEKSPTVPIHPQVLADYRTVLQVGNAVMAEVGQ